MYIDKETKVWVNTDAPYKGFSKLDTPEIRARAGLIEVPDPVPPADYSDETYYRHETPDRMPPYVTFERKSDEQLEELRKSKITAQIAALDGGHPTARPLREFALLTMEKLAVDAGITVAQLREADYGYRKMKELDEQINALREQLP